MNKTYKSQDVIPLVRITLSDLILFDMIYEYVGSDKIQYMTKTIALAFCSCWNVNDTVREDISSRQHYWFYQSVVFICK